MGLLLGSDLEGSYPGEQRMKEDKVPLRAATMANTIRSLSRLRG